MTRSANEVMTLAAKAARGAGAPPAQAASFGSAAVCHLRAERDPQALHDALRMGTGGPLLTLPLACARLLEDAKDGIAKGVLCLPNADLTLQLSYAEALPFAKEIEITEHALHLRVDLTTPVARSPVSRVRLPEDLAKTFADLAARTFVPESDASRLSGAGAGLTDND